RDSVVVRYDPPESLREQLHDVRLIAGVEKGVVTGNVIVHKRGRDLKDALRGLAGCNSQTLTLRIPCWELRDKEGQPCADGAIGHIAYLLRMAVAQPDEFQHSLLRASASPSTIPA